MGLPTYSQNKHNAGSDDTESIICWNQIQPRVNVFHSDSDIVPKFPPQTHEPFFVSLIVRYLSVLHLFEDVGPCGLIQVHSPILVIGTCPLILFQSGLQVACVAFHLHLHLLPSPAPQLTIQESLRGVSVQRGEAFSQDSGSRNKYLAALIIFHRTGKSMVDLWSFRLDELYFRSVLCIAGAAHDSLPYRITRVV